MKVQRKISPTTIVEAEGQSVAEVFEQLARLEAVFHGYETCGLCGQSHVAYDCQEDRDGNKYYKARCLDCAAQFRFGVKRSPPGVLFPQLKDASGHYKPDGGWSVWQARDDS